MTIMIPQPKTYGPLGNIPQMNANTPFQSLMSMAQKHGEIFRLKLPVGNLLIVSGYELMKELANSPRFGKVVEKTVLEKVRTLGGDGLFTSETNDPNWHKAHNILLPNFSRTAMRGYFDMMLDLAMQLIQKWERLNPDEEIDIPEDMTRLTLDTIALCGFNYRFNSFYREDSHPFVASMVRALDEALNQAQRLGIQDKIMVKTRKQFKQDIDFMFSQVDKIIAERRANGSQGEKDLLSHMLHSKDSETGETLEEENIRYQIITFLVAGHETTSGLLSFAIYYLLNNPDKLQKAYEEVDSILTDLIPTYEQVKQLKYIRMILDESLRLWPTAPAFNLEVKEDTVLAGKYDLKKGDRLTVLIPQLHRDVTAWGEDAELFRPERFEDPSKIPFDAYKPFGLGQRACIGQQFALQEATLVLGLILKNFELIDHTQYKLNVRESLTVKPNDFKLKVRARKKQKRHVTEASGNILSTESRIKKIDEKVIEAQHNTPLLVLYGSDLGTAEGLARELADAGRVQGFQSNVAALNEYTAKLPTEGIVYIVTASYNGLPPTNASQFVQWLKEEQIDLTGVRYCIFGCGDRNWASTYQKVPMLIDELMVSKGAQRIVPLGEGDMNGDFETNVEEWQQELWPSVMRTMGLKINEKVNKTSPALSMKVVDHQIEVPLARAYNAFNAKIAKNQELRCSIEGSTRHIEIKLPEGVTYREGDHLGVLPRNRQSLVNRVLQRFQLNGNDYVILTKTGLSMAHLPLDQPVKLFELLSTNVELQEAATRVQLRELMATTDCPPHKKELETLLEEQAYHQKILKKRISMLDLLEQYEACEMTFERFLELLPPLKVRYYSISSSPTIQPEQPSITVSVVKAPAWNGKAEYRGVASNFLAETAVGDSIVMFIRAQQSDFQLPTDPATPIIMVGPGVGIAPFRGFLQARLMSKNAGEQLGEAILYFGCRNESDDIYAEELKRYEQDGIVKVYKAYSRKDGQSKEYVQHLMGQTERAQELIKILDQDGHFYICGDGSKMAPDVERTLLMAYRVVHDVNESAAKQWLAGLKEQGRYAMDVWAGSNQ